MRCLAFLLLLPLAAPAADYDIVIRGARVIDGSGKGEMPGTDVGIKGGRIAAIGRVTGTGDVTIDAAGRVLTPGFIDVHTHVEGGIEKNPRGDNFLLDGVTTVITGNCGSSEIDLAGWFAKLATAGLGLNVGS